MAEHGVKAVFSDRSGGFSKPPFDSLNLGFGLGDSDSHVSKNIDVLCAQAHLAFPHQAKQVHGSQVLICSDAGSLHDVEADILLTTTAKVPVAVRTADCVPILLADAQSGVAAAVHAGWRGTVLQVVQTAISTMCTHGALTENILASIGPCIGSCCFEINHDIAQQLHAACGSDVSNNQGERQFGDLVKANYLQMMKMDVRETNIELNAHCTVCHAQPDYFSYRRDNGVTGRQLSIIALP